MTPSICWLPVFFALLAAPAVADDIPDPWTTGREAYAAGNYHAALRAFERARDAGQSGPAVYYNIGVSHYRLQDYAAARKTFTQLDDRYPAMRPLAQYNLGLVALKLGEHDAAAGHFRSSYLLAGDDPKLRALASTQLRRLIDDRGPAAEWLRAFSARAGYDDNVTLQDKTGIATDLSADSSFVEAFGTLRGPNPGWNGVRFDGSFFVLRYPDASDFNQASVNAGALYDWQHGDWSLDAGAHLATTSLGGERFDRSVRLSTRITRWLNRESSIALRYRHDDVSAIDSMFDGIEGSRHRFDVRFRWYRDDRHLTVNLARETNDRADPSVSPDKLKLQVDYRYAPEVGWGYGIGMELRGSEYPGTAPARDEDLVQFDARLTRHTESGWQLFAEVLRADNDSSDPAFSYERNQASIGVYRFF